MTNLQSLSIFLTERLMLAAQEIFKAVEVTVTEYHDEISRFRQENELLKSRLLEAGIQVYPELQPGLSVFHGEPCAESEREDPGEKVLVKQEPSGSKEEPRVPAHPPSQTSVPEEPVSPRACLEDEQRVEEMLHPQMTDNRESPLLQAHQCMQIKEETNESKSGLGAEIFCMSQSGTSDDPSSAIASSHVSGLDTGLDELSMHNAAEICEMDLKKASDVKAKRRVISMETKRKIISKYENGMRIKDLVAMYNLPKSTICTYLANKKKIKEANVLPSMSHNVNLKQRPQALNEMETLLVLWIKEKQRMGDGVDQGIICKKAKEIYRNLTKDDKDKVPFVASHGWFYRFRKRHGIHSVVRHGEAASADKAAEQFVQDFAKFISEDNYVSQQIFNCVETGLFWKKMPNRTFITKEEKSMPGHKPMKDRLTLLLCANASGDCKVKPLLVYHSENPRAFKKHNVCKDSLPVLWRANPKAWVNRELFREWVRKVFVPWIKKYLQEKGLPLKCVLVLDNATAHPPDLGDELEAEFDWITVKFLPLNSTSLIQPMDQMVIANFKKLYTKHLFRKCFYMTNSSNLTLKEYWKDHFSIYQCIQLIDMAWKEVTIRTLNSAWKKLVPSVVAERDFEGFEEEEKVVEEILRLCTDLHLEVNSQDVEELVESHREDLTTEDLKELQEEKESSERGEFQVQGDEEEELNKLTLSTDELKDMCKKWRDLEFLFDKFNPDKSASFSAISVVNDTVMPYFKNLLKKRKKQVTLVRFLKPIPVASGETATPGDGPQPGPSGIKKMRREKTPRSLPSVFRNDDSPSDEGKKSPLPPSPEVDSPPPDSEGSSSSN